MMYDKLASISTKHDDLKYLQAYGIVWRAVDRRKNHVVALKKIFDAFQNATDAQRTFREIVFLQVFILTVLTSQPSIIPDLCNIKSILR